MVPRKVGGGVKKKDCDCPFCSKTEIKPETSRCEKLMLCPFCGIDSKRMVFMNYVKERDQYFVSCGGCGTSTTEWEYAESAIMAWNTREGKIPDWSMQEHPKKCCWPKGDYRVTEDGDVISLRCITCIHNDNRYTKRYCHMGYTCDQCGYWQPSK